MAEQQDLAALSALKGAFLTANTPPPDGLPLQAAQMLAEVALLLALPAPSSRTEMDEQIAALQSSSLRAYAAAHSAWAFPVMERVQRRLPDPDAVPGKQAGGAPWTPQGWRQYVARLLA